MLEIQPQAGSESSMANVSLGISKIAFCCVFLREGLLDLCVIL